MCSFPHFSPTCFDILNWKFAYDFVLMYYRSSLSVVTFGQFLKRSYPSFYTPVFRRDVLWYGDVRPSVRPSGSPSVRPSVRHSFPHFSPICFEILSWNFVYHFILMHVRSSSNAINFRQLLLELCPFWTSHSYKYAVFHFSYMLWHIELKFCIWLCFTLLQIKFEFRKFASIFVGVTPLLELRILEIHSFPHFSLTSFDILS